jgi:DNA topoisomerase VI subunit B
VKVGLKIMHTCSSSVPYNSKKSKQHLEEEEKKLEEKLNSKSIAQVAERINKSLNRCYKKTTGRCIQEFN